MEINSKILEVADAYQRMYGTSDTFKKYQIAQMVHESANGTSQLAIENNNYSGLTQSEWNGDENKQPDGDNYYRTFSNPEEYARAMHDDYFVYYPEIHNATTAGEYAHILKENGYYGADEMEYGQSLASIADETYIPSENMGRYYAGVTGLEKGIGKRILDFSDDTFVPMVDTNIGGFWKQTKDSFLNEWFNNGSVSLLRTALTTDHSGNTRGLHEQWSVSEDDRKTVSKLFEGDLETQHFLLSTARSQDQLYRLIEQKREDKAREERVEKAGYGVKSLGGLVGTLLDPLNLIPVLGQEAVLANMAMRLGSKTIANIGLNKALQIAEVGITNGLINMGDQWLANKYGGYTPDYTTAFLFGGAMGAGAKYLHSLSSTHKSITGDTPETDKLMNQVEAEGEQALMQSVGMKPVKVADVESPTAVRRITPDEARHLLNHKRSNAWKEAKEELELTNSDLKTHLKEITANPDKYLREANSPIVKNTDGSVTVNDVTLSKDSLIATVAGADDNHILDNIEMYMTPEEKVRLKEQGNDTIPLYKQEPLGFEMVTPEDIEKELDEHLHTAISDLLELDDEIPLKSAESQNKATQALIVEPIALIDTDKLYGKGGISKPEDVLLENQGSTGMLGKVKQQAETGRYFGTTFGNMVNSPANTLRHFVNLFLTDPRDRGNNKGLPVDLAKKVTQQQYKVVLAKGEYCFKNWYLQQPMKKWKDFNQAHKDFNALVTKAYHEKYLEGKDITKYGNAINDAVKVVDEFRELDLRLLKENGLVSPDFDGSKELYRRIDKSKVNLLREDFVNEDAMFNFLRKYVELAVDKDKLEQGIDLRTEAEEYAKHILRAGEHRFEDGELKDNKGDKRLAYFKKRLPMKTNLVVPLNIVGGATDKALNKTFSFDANLRDNNIFNHMNYVTNRSSGAIALKQTLGVDDIGGLAWNYDKRIAKELNEAVEQGYISKEEAEKQYLDMHRALHHVTGARIFEDVLPTPDNAMDKIRDILLDTSYAINGMNFGLSAVAEHVGAISKVGARALTHFIPKLHDFVHDLKYSKYVTAEQLKDFRRSEIGAYIAETNWWNPMVTDRAYLENQLDGLHMEALGQTHDGITMASRVTSTLSQVQQITNHSIQSIKADLVPDVIAWSNDEFSSSLRKNLFSEDKFKRVGIDDIDEFKALVKHHLSDLDPSDPTALSRSLQEWQKVSPDTYTKFHAFLDKHSMDVILQPHFSAGNTRITGFIVPILMQFKAFSRMALNSHLMRGLENWQREDTIQTLATALAGGMLWAIRQRAYAEYQYGDNEKAKQKFLDKTFTTENILTAGITRSSMLSSLSFGDDAKKIITGQGSNTRTTVDRYEWNKSDDLSDKVADRARQFAVLGTAMRLWNGATNGLESIGVLEENQKSGKGVNPLMQMYPLDRYLPIQIFLTGASELADKAEREMKALQRRQQRRQQEENLRTITKTPRTTNQSNIKEVIKNPNKRQELIQGINQEKPKELKRRKAETLSNDELVNIYNAYREQKGQ